MGIQADPETGAVPYPTAVAQEVGLVVVIKGYRLVPVQQIDIGFVFPYRGKRGVDQKPVELQQVLGRHFILYKWVVLLGLCQGQAGKHNQYEVE